MTNNPAYICTAFITTVKSFYKIVSVVRFFNLLFFFTMIVLGKTFLNVLIFAIMLYRLNKKIAYRALLQISLKDPYCLPLIPFYGSPANLGTLALPPPVRFEGPTLIG